MWATWWIWLAGGFVLGAIEVVVPGFIFLGFALGAIITGLLLAAGIIGTNLAIVALVFALASLAAWFGLHKGFAAPQNQTKRWETDIND